MESVTHIVDCRDRRLRLPIAMLRIVVPCAPRAHRFCFPCRRDLFIVGRTVGTNADLIARSNRWRRIGLWVLLVLSVLAVAAIVGSSLSPEHYYFRSAEARRAFAPDPWDVGTAFLLSAGEGAVLCLIVCIEPGRRLWRRLLLALVVFVPWLFVVWEQVGTHVPGFLMINSLGCLNRDVPHRRIAHLVCNPHPASHEATNWRNAGLTNRVCRPPVAGLPMRRSWLRGTTLRPTFATGC